MKEIDDSIKHWERMIAWAKKQPKRNKTSSSRMEIEINETAAAVYCGLCDKFFPNCTQCTLAIKFSLTEDGCVEQYYKVIYSKTWGEWERNAKVMLEDLKSLRGQK